MKNSLVQIIFQLIVLPKLYLTLTEVPYGDSIAEEDIVEDPILSETVGETLESEDEYSQEIDVRASESDVTYHFYSKEHPKGVDLTHNTAELLNDTDFCVKKFTLFIVHGWQGDRESQFNYHVKEALLGKHSINFFAVDWSPVAKRNYLTAQRAVLQVGNYVAEFIKTLQSTYGLQLSKVAFVGHSLGAHISGNAGAALAGQVEYIVGLDPASPFFTRLNIDNRLDYTDAKFVQAIHTNGGYLGVKKAVGHSDYYPNGGTKQPGCGYDLFGTCAHARAWSYYAESVEVANNPFVSTKCFSYKAYLAGKCRNNTVSLMAGYPIDTNASGNYYLTTNCAPPFGKG